jgi:two-component system, response regulator / RNA-binding antiterminator
VRRHHAGMENAPPRKAGATLTLGPFGGSRRIFFCIAQKQHLLDIEVMSAAPLNILVIDENRIRAAIIEDGLREAGHRKVTVVHDVSGIARRVIEVGPDVIVIDLENPNRDMLESMFQLSRTVKRPIAMFVDRSDSSSIEAAVEAGVSAYVVDGLKKERVKTIMDMAISRFNAFSRMERELEEARSELEGRKVIDRAKGILMKSRGLSEEEAYGLMRRTAMNQNRKIAEIAQSLVTAAELLGPKGGPDG